MALINRVSRLFRADFNAVLDRIEEPEQVLKQAIRDMEDELADAGRRHELGVHEQEALSARRQELEAKMADIDEELDLCFAKQKDELARALVKRKLEAERLHARLESKQGANQKRLDQERARIDENRATLDGLRQKAEIFARSAPRPDTESRYDDAGWVSRELSVSDDDVEVAFLREQQARSGS